MSNIPSNAVSNALTPVQRQTNDAARARTIQAQKNDHHAEEVEELDDTAVNSVDDEKQQGAHDQSRKKKKGRKQITEVVDIDALQENPPQVTPATPEVPGLDISA